ncbi:dihydrolipoyl dehydrogenase family protein [Ferrovibrio xuzhouensis]|uniref:Dihydrolipoyl dehydrogenase family protein n=1 Tax=Ferrovibrio xuzhouensis TaxID=1576914 RepID=A0ABV7VK69_9PROT
MTERIDCDIAVIGAGSAGLSVAAGAAMLGVRTVLIERGRMGGDCLNYGCVPSKALIAASRHAVGWRQAGRLGIRYAEPEIDFPAVMRHVQDTIAAIAPNDSIERFTALGVQVLQGEACFTGPDSLTVDGRRIHARRFVIATGSQPLIPPIEGLADTPYLTNETVFALDRLPLHLLVIGGGPVGIELAQAFRRLGSRVSVIEQRHCLPREDTELSGPVLDALRDDGVDIRQQTAVVRAENTAAGIVLTLQAADGTTERIAGSHLLVAAGRRPAVDGLTLERAGIASGPAGITVDRGLRTSNRRVYAIGDVTGLSPFTHTAGYHAALVLKNALFRLPAKADHDLMPRVTYSDPELAAVGLDEAAARARHGAIRILRWPFAATDRAQAEGRTQGLVKVIVTPRGRILGAGIVGPDAGDLLQPWSLALGRRLGIGAMQAMIAPYPTRSEAGKRVAGEFFRPQLFNPLTRRLVRLLARLG